MDDLGFYQSPYQLKAYNVLQSSHKILKIFNKEIIKPPELVLLNCAAALFIADKAKNIGEGMKMAEEVVMSDAAAKKLNDLIKLTNS